MNNFRTYSARGLTVEEDKVSGQIRYVRTHRKMDGAKSETKIFRTILVSPDTAFGIAASKSMAFTTPKVEQDYSVHTSLRSLSKRGSTYKYEFPDGSSRLDIFWYPDDGP